MDQLAAKNKRLENDLEEVTKKYETLFKQAEGSSKRIAALEVIIQDMFLQVPTDILKRIKYRS